MDSRNEPKVDLKKAGLLTLAIYIAVVVIIYFSGGDQLHYRVSRGSLDMPGAETATVELSQGCTVEQVFFSKIQILESVSVQWGTYYRENAGTVTMELRDQAYGNLLMEKSFNAAEIEEGAVTTMEAETPLEGYYDVPLVLRIYADSPVGYAVSPMMSIEKQTEGFTLTLNGENTAGTLCFSATGRDYIWTGLHYWEFAAAGAGLLALLFVVVWYRDKKGHSYVVNALIAWQKYRFLFQQLVARDFKTKYKRSVLGMFWSFLNPLLTMSVQYVVFSTIFRSSIDFYPAYLLIGIVSFNFFNEACGMSLSSIVGNAALIKKVYMAKYIYPVTRVMSSVINLAISLIPLVLVCFLTGVRFHKSVILTFYFLICLIIFSTGLGMLLASSMVFFRDTQFLWGVLSMIWMYMTPVFYPEEILPDNFKIVHQLNPLYHFLKCERMCILNGVSPEPIMFINCMLMAVGMLVLGALVFRKVQDRFVLYL